MLTDGGLIVTKRLSAGAVDESLRNTLQSRIASNVQDAKQSTNTFSLKAGLENLLDNPNVFDPTECFVGQIISHLNPDEAQLLKTALADKRIRHVDLVRLCEAEGYKMSEATMRRHRARGCRCDQ